MSNDIVAYEDLKVRNMVRNRHLAKSITDAAWTQFRTWVEYFGKVFGVVTVAVPPHYTSQNCSNCGKLAKKSLSTRTHTCQHCGHTADRDWNAARNILEKGLRTVGHTGTGTSPLLTSTSVWVFALGVSPWERKLLHISRVVERGSPRSDSRTIPHAHSVLCWLWWEDVNPLLPLPVIPSCDR
jgi:IS605 OrfB family transposase